jgi:hypothetical protein
MANNAATITINEHVKIVSNFASGVRDLLNEGLCMCKLDNVRVLRVLAIAHDQYGAPMLVLPYMVNGDLHTYITQHKNVI